MNQYVVATLGSDINQYLVKTLGADSRSATPHIPVVKHTTFPLGSLRDAVDFARAHCGTLTLDTNGKPALTAQNALAALTALPLANWGNVPGNRNANQSLLPPHDLDEDVTLKYDLAFKMDAQFAK